MPKSSSIRPFQAQGSLVVVMRLGSRRNHSLWLCVCECGEMPLVTSENLVGQRSCKRCARRTHGASRDRAASGYKCWAGMVERCRNPRARQYVNYGARGIRVCDRWLRFENFIEDMGPRPSLAHSVERLDVNGDYEPGNCKWLPLPQQARNRRDTVWLTVNGETLSRGEWAERQGTSVHAIRGRMRIGWSAEDAVLTPIGSPRGGEKEGGDVTA